MENLIHVNDAEFQKMILSSTIPVVVDFWAPWCGPCKAIASVLEKLAKDYAGKLIVAKVNTDENPEWAMKYGVQGIPTLLFVDKGAVMDRLVGASPAPVIQGKIKNLIDEHEHGN
jgi:thioredoxin 1